MNSTHEAKIIRISEVLPHTNADSLELIHIGGYQVVVRKGQFKPGDLAVYIQPDSVVPVTKPFEFLWADKITPGQMPIDRYRRITVRRFRKEWSEGLLMPMGDFFPRAEDWNYFDEKFTRILDEGSDVAELLGITHYNPPEPDEDDSDRVSIKQSKVWPRSWTGWKYFLAYHLSFHLYNPWGNLGGANETAPKNTPPTYDVDAWKNYKDTFIEGEPVVVTEKIHGSNARYVYQPGYSVLLPGGHFYAGSRKLWKKSSSKNVWREAAQNNPEIERWCKNHPNYVLYGEVVPTQSSKKGFKYDYASNGQATLYAFDIRTPDGEWLPYSEFVSSLSTYDIKTAPLIYDGPFSEAPIRALVDGKTLTGAGHIREGVVIKTVPERHVHGLGRAQLKLVSNDYYEAEK